MAPLSVDDLLNCVSKRLARFFPERFLVGSIHWGVADDALDTGYPSSANDEMAIDLNQAAPSARAERASLSVTDLAHLRTDEAGSSASEHSGSIEPIDEAGGLDPLRPQPDHNVTIVG